MSRPDELGDDVLELDDVDALDAVLRDGAEDAVDAEDAFGAPPDFSASGSEEWRQLPSKKAPLSTDNAE